MKMWFLYIVRASDGSLYTGISIDVAKRVAKHNLGKGAKALRGKLPVTLIYSEKYKGATEARKREAEVKSWPRSKKLKLVGGKTGD